MQGYLSHDMPMLDLLAGLVYRVKLLSKDNPSANYAANCD